MEISNHALARAATTEALTDAVLALSQLPAARELARRAMVLDWIMSDYRAARELGPQEYERILDAIENLLNTTKEQNA